MALIATALVYDSETWKQMQGMKVVWVGRRGGGREVVFEEPFIRKIMKT